MCRGKRAGPPPIPLLHHGARLSEREFLDDTYIILEALYDDSKPLGYAIGKLTRVYPMDGFGAHVMLDYVVAENDCYRWCIYHIDEAGGLPSLYTHHLRRRAVSTCVRREGKRTIHVQKWSAIEKADAHALLQSWGYRGFVDMAASKRQDDEKLTAGASAKKKARKPAPEPAEEDVGPYVPDLVDGAGEPEPEKTFRGATGKGSVAKALEASNVLDKLLAGDRPETGRTGSGHRRPRATAVVAAGPLEERLGELREKLVRHKTSVKRGTAAAALADKVQAAASTAAPRRKRKRAEAVVSGRCWLRAGKAQVMAWEAMRRTARRPRMRMTKTWLGRQRTDRLL